MSDKSQPTTPPTGEDEHSLNEALTDLEDILDGQASDTEGDGSELLDAQPDEQYTIPLLDDVLVAGSELVDEIDEVIPTIRRELASVDDDESQAVIKRLTNEIEVIVQAGVEEALKGASKSITAQVRKHVNIILPEILDEIADIKARNRPL